MMTTKKLIEILKQYPEDTEVGIEDTDDRLAVYELDVQPELFLEETGNIIILRKK